MNKKVVGISSKPRIRYLFGIFVHAVIPVVLFCAVVQPVAAYEGVVRVRDGGETKGRLVAADGKSSIKTLYIDSSEPSSNVVTTVSPPTHTEGINFSKVPDVRIFKGDETIGYRDPAAWYEDGVFHLFITVCDPSVPRMTIGHSTSRNLIDWSPVEYVLPMDKRFNWSSPGNIVKVGDERVLCFQKYPTPDATPTKVAFADDTARLYTIRTKDFKTWTKPEIIMVKGPNVSEAEMGRMIDAYLVKGTDGLWWCFYKQQQDKSGRFSKKARMGVPFSVSADLKVWKQKGFTDGGENVCVLPDDHTGGWLMLHSPNNGIGFKRSTDLVHWADCGKTVLGQQDWNWAKGRITAATVIDCRAVKGVGKYVMFFHGSGPRKEIDGDCYKNCSIGIAWSDDLKEWTWPGKVCKRCLP